MDDIKRYAKNEKDLKTLMQTIRIYSQVKKRNLSYKNVPNCHTKMSYKNVPKMSYKNVPNLSYKNVQNYK